MLKLTVKKTPHESEWVARITDDGKLISSYFGSDRQDAEVTGKMMLAQVYENTVYVDGKLMLLEYKEAQP